MSCVIKTAAPTPPNPTRVKEFPAGTFLRQKLDHRYVVLVIRAEGDEKKQGVVLTSGIVRNAEFFYAEYEPVSRIEIDQAA